jgi:hypothetical protein
VSARFPERYRGPGRLVAVAIAYVVYRLPGDDRLTAGLLLGFGTLARLWTAVDALTLSETERPRYAGVAGLTAGAGLVVAGLLSL